MQQSPTESASVCQDIFKDLKLRDLQNTDLLVIDDLSGLDCAIEQHFDSKVQKCVLHLKRNLLKRVKKTHRSALAEDLAEVF